MYEAARFHDRIEHRCEAAGLLFGLVVGAALTLAIVGTGGAAAVVAGAVLAGASMGAATGESLFSLSAFAHEAGKIQENCSPDVFINGRPAVTVNSVVSCDNHPLPVPQIAQGSATVFINGQPVVRRGDKLTCGGAVMDGSNNVFIGGGTQTLRTINPVIPGWVHGALLVAGLGGALLSGVGIVPLFIGFVGATGGGLAAHKIAGDIWGDGSDQQIIAELLGSYAGGGLGGQAGKLLNRWIAPKTTGIWTGLAREGIPGVYKGQRVQAYKNKPKLKGPTSNWKKYLAKEKEAIEKAPLRKKARAFDKRAKEIRNSLPTSKLRKKGNIGIAEVNIAGVKKQFIACSRINSINDKGADIEDFSLLKKESDKIFTQYEKLATWEGGEKFDRDVDTEAKILEHIASLIDEDSEGDIILYTEKPPCKSCSNIINEFRERFPNINLIVLHKDI